MKGVFYIIKKKMAKHYGFAIFLADLVSFLLNRISVRVQITDRVAPAFDFFQFWFNYAPVADDQDGHFIGRQVFVGNPIDIFERNGVDLWNKFVEIRIRQTVNDEV